MLKKIKDNFANMYEGEILKFNSDEFKALSFLRVKGGENCVLWYSKDSLRELLKFGRDKINKILNNLEDAGAIIIFNAKDQNSKKNASNVYYLAEYNPLTKTYMTANTIEEIKDHALHIRQEKEKEYATKNNLTAREFILEERLTKEERKTKFFVSKPPTENQYMEPPTENQYMEPPTENQYIIYNKKVLNNKKYLNNKKNNNNKEIKKQNIDTTVVVNTDHINLIKNHIDENITTITFEEAKILAKDLLSTEKEFNFEIFKERVATIKNYSGEIKNVIGITRKAIKEKWNIKSHGYIKKDTFNDYDQRTYDFNDLERKLLGWDNGGESDND